MSLPAFASAKLPVLKLLFVAEVRICLLLILEREDWVRPLLMPPYLATTVLGRDPDSSVWGVTALAFYVFVVVEVYFALAVSFEIGTCRGCFFEDDCRDLVSTCGSCFFALRVVIVSTYFCECPDSPVIST